MLLMLLIGWVVLLPALVVAGLYVCSRVLGRRHAAMNAYDDLFEDEQLSDAVLDPYGPAVRPGAIPGAVRPAPERAPGRGRGASAPASVGAITDRGD